MNIYKLCRVSHNDKEVLLSKYEAFILGEPTVPVGDIPPEDLVSEIKGMVFRYASAPGTVSERNYMANNSSQKQMSQDARFKFAKFNFPAKV